MDLQHKQRIIGIIVLIILAAVLLPLFFTGSKKTIKNSGFSATIPTVPPKPVIKSTPETRAWAVQLATFRVRSHAAALVNRLKNKGYSFSRHVY